jgi:hypothetical protein
MPLTPTCSRSRSLMAKMAKLLLERHIGSSPDRGPLPPGCRSKKHTPSSAGSRSKHLFEPRDLPDLCQMMIIMLRDKIQMIYEPHGLLQTRMQCLVLAKSSGCSSRRRSSRRSREVRNCTRISSSFRPLWLPSSVLRLVRSATVRVSTSVRKSLTPAIQSGSRSARWPACSWADHLLPCFSIKALRGTLRNISSSRTGLPQAGCEDSGTARQGT